MLYLSFLSSLPSRILPPHGGVGQPWHFPFHQLYWSGKNAASNQDEATVSSSINNKNNSGVTIKPHQNDTIGYQHEHESAIAPSDSKDFEPLFTTHNTRDGQKSESAETPIGKGETGQMPALRVHNIRKQYAAGFSAVCGVSFDLLQGQLSVLLGPNGAGKTTTLRFVI